MLTGREKQLLRRLAERKPDRLIAAEIGGTQRQIAEQRKRLLGRLGLSSDEEIRKAAEALAQYGPVKTSHK
jgi:DNA-binding CsgD family transcriptional regulator